MYATLDRAASLNRMGIEPRATADMSHGPSCIIVPRDRLGKALSAACTPYLEDAPLSLTVDQRHTECLLTRQGRRQVAERIAKALEYLL